MIDFLENRQKVSREMAQLNYELYQRNKFVMPLSFVFKSNLWRSNKNSQGNQGLSVNIQANSVENICKFFLLFNHLDDGSDRPLFKFVRKLSNDLDIFKSIPLFKNENISSENIFSSMIQNNFAKKFKQSIMPGIDQHEDHMFDLSMVIGGNRIVANGLTLLTATRFVGSSLETVWNKYGNALKSFELFSFSKESFRCFFSAIDSLDYTDNDLLPLSSLNDEVTSAIEFSLDLRRGASVESKNLSWEKKLIKRHKLFPEQVLESFEITTKPENIEKFMI